MNKPMTPAALLTAAIALIESDSIRAWANGQRHAFLYIAKSWRKHNSSRNDPTAFATYITAVALGA